MLHCGDSLVVLPTLAEASVEAVVTDPPYGLEFMGKEWDRLAGDWNSHEGETIRSPGRKAAKFKTATPRYHAGASAQAWHQGWATAVLRVLKPGGYMLCFGGTRTFHRLACAAEDAGFEIRDCLSWNYATGFPKGKACLKPAWEPILLCRKPGRGVRPLNVDACRVPTSSDDLEEMTGRSGRSTPNKVWGEGIGSPNGWEPTPAGRYPANVLHDGSEEVLEAFAAFGSKGGGFGVRGGDGEGVIAAQGVNKYHRAGRKDLGQEVGYGDTGTAARFFYCAKASKAERGEGNSHPCVKPLALVRWLVRLVSLPGETVLDPFAGSGTTPLACEAEGRQWLAIEREPDYCAIINNRLAAARVETPLFPEAV